MSVPHDLPPGCPPLAWPDLPDDEARLAWYRAAADAYLATWPSKTQLADEAAIAALEARLGCALPEALRTYHLRVGVLRLGEKLCSVTSEGLYPIVIGPLRAAYPSIDQRVDDAADHALVDRLVVFGDYLGSGNMFAFHRDNGAVWYFDHDDGAPLTRFFDDVQTYLEALMIVSLGVVYEPDGDNEAAEELLVERFGKDLVRKWRY